MGSWSETVLVQVIAIAVAVLCVLTALILGLKEERRTRRQRSEPVAPNVYFGLVLTWLVARSYIPNPLLRTAPLSVLVPAMDIAVFAAFAVTAAAGMWYAFQRQWHWKIGLRQSLLLLLPLGFGMLLYEDYVRYQSMPWVWALGALIAVLLIPLFTRLTFLTLSHHFRKIEGETPEAHAGW